jgi:hypothetical protein
MENHYLPPRSEADLLGTQEELLQPLVQAQLLLHPPSGELMGPFFPMIAKGQRAWRIFHPTVFLKIVGLFFENSAVGLSSIQLGIVMSMARN